MGAWPLTHRRGPPSRVVESFKAAEERSHVDVGKRCDGGAGQTWPIWYLQIDPMPVWLMLLRL
jgi:hypothetical protein